MNYLQRVFILASMALCRMTILVRHEPISRVAPGIENSVEKMGPFFIPQKAEVSIMIMCSPCIKRTGNEEKEEKVLLIFKVHY